MTKRSVRHSILPICKRSVRHPMSPTSKRGVSEIVATVLIIMLTVAAVGIIWVGVLPLVKDNLGSFDVCKKVDISIETTQGYTCYSSSNITLIQIKKGSNDVNVLGVKFYLSSVGNSIPFTTNDSLKRNSFSVFYLNTTGISKLDTIEVAPIVKSGNSEKICAGVYVVPPLSACSSALTGDEITKIMHSGGHLINPDVISLNSNAEPIILPKINIASPINNSAYTSNLVWLNVSSDQVVEWKYSLNGASNVSFIPNISLPPLVNGNYNITVYANNSNGTISKYLNFSVSVPCSTQNAQGFFNGTGTVSDPYGICNCTMLQNMNNYLTSNFILLSDIDCSVTSGWSGGAGFTPVGDCGADEACGGFYEDDDKTFAGNFDGNGNTISNLTINRSGISNVGLFGFVTGNISNVNLNVLNVTGKGFVGGLAGYSSGTIYNSLTIVLGNVVVVSGGSAAGGLAGYSSGTIYNSSAIVLGNVVAPSNAVGGLVGSSWGTISGSSATVSGRVTGAGRVGGLVGFSTGTISNSSATIESGGNVTANITNAGGLVGYFWGTISNSYVVGSGNVTANSTNAGGLVGYQDGGSINNSYSIVRVSGNTNVGGLVGYRSGGSIANSYWDNQTSGRETSAGGTRKTTLEMQTQSNFTNWDFTNIWAINAGKNSGYPYLRWQNLVGI